MPIFPQYVAARTVQTILMAACLLILAFARPGMAQEVTVHFFWQEGCPHCKSARDVLSEMHQADPATVVEAIELGVSSHGNTLFERTVTAFGIDRPAVPLVVIGERHFVGYAGPETARRYADMVASCRDGSCRDIVAELRERGPGGPAPGPTRAASADDLPETVSLPWLGEVSLRGLSLPLLTVVLGAIDGFNPCAMWVLALLIGLLLGVEDSRRMWVLGLVFLAATGVMYFAVMSAWLSVVLWIGAVGWLRLAIGALAIAAGIYYLREYWTNPEGICRVTPGGRRKSISDAFRGMVERPSLVVASLGVAALAIAVNLIELVCSAGVPAVYTQILAMHDLPARTYYAYLALYLAVFLFDDAAIFVVAMVTLRAVASTGRYSRLSHLIGGIVLLALGAVMVLRPDLLG